MNKNNLSKIALIIGIISVVFTSIECYLPLIIIGLILGIAAIILGFISRHISKDKLSFSGIVLGICSIIVSIIWLYLYIIA